MIDPSDYVVSDTRELLSPSLVLFRDLLEKNLAETIRLCGGPDRWRPHVKTHKTREIVQRQLELGVTKHKCATLAEAEMLAAIGVQDILIAYPLVGPNIRLLSNLIEQYSKVRFTVLVDSPELATGIGDLLAQRGQQVSAFMDLNSGMNRTGVFVGPAAIELYDLIVNSPGLAVAGLHWYDGHNRQEDFEERQTAVLTGWEHFTKFRDQLLMNGFEVPQVVASGSGAFAILAQTEEPNLELSPGTTTLFDADCNERMSELNLRPAVAVFTRVVSHSGGRRVTLDVGHKSCAADQPAGRRLFFPSIPDAQEVQHTEEHLVIETSAAGDLEIGQGVFAISRHICPTMALHETISVVEGGEVVDCWEIAARNRRLKNYAARSEF